jgi:hypothetical protein
VPASRLEKQASRIVHRKCLNAHVVAAVQEFLRFQIREHKTGDALEVF